MKRQDRTVDRVLDRPSQGPEVRGTARDRMEKDRGPGTVDRVLDRPSQGPEVRGKARDNIERSVARPGTGWKRSGKWGMLVLAFLVFAQPLRAQFYFYDEKRVDPEFLVEGGAGVGLMAAKTDLGRRSLIPAVQDFHSWVELMARIQWRKGLALKISYGSGNVSGADSLERGQSAGAMARRQRNLHFQSTIKEIAVAIEWLPWLNREEPITIQPYFFAGCGYFFFHPEGFLDGRLVDLQSLGTERQPGNENRPSYPLRQFSIPAGLGLRYECSALVAISIQFNHRFLFTDYLDDVSTRFISVELAGERENGATAELLKNWYDLSDPRVSQPGAIRGNPRNKDCFSSLSIGISLALNRKRI